MKHQSFFQWCQLNDRGDLLSEWDYEENSKCGIFPDNIGCKSTSKTVNWICPSGHHYDAYVANRTKRGDSCPYCSNHRLLVGYNDLAHIAPGICEEWDYQKNGEKHTEDVSRGKKNPHPSSPEEIMYGSSTKVYWKCKKGHESYSSPNARKVGMDGSFADCDRCADESRVYNRRKTIAGKKNLAVLVPQVIDEWIYSEHDLVPEDVSCNSTELVHWKCKKGHEFDKRVTERVSLAGGRYFLHQCSECARYQRTSIAEQICFYYISSVLPDAVNPYKELGFEIDIYIPSLRIGFEYDGSYTHRNRLDKDNEKDDMAANNGIRLFRMRPAILPNTNSAQRITIKETTQGVIDGLIQFFTIIGVSAPPMDINKDYDEIMKIFSDRTGKSIVYSALIDEWDYDKNTIDPKFITSKESHIKVWWKCPKGHPSYQSVPYNRTARHTGCPICANNRFRKSTQKKVRNIETGEIFESITEAEKKYGKPGNTSISCCCRGRYKKAYDYHWEYYVEEE